MAGKCTTVVEARTLGVYVKAEGGGELLRG